MDRRKIEKLIILFCWMFILGITLATACFHGVTFSGREIIPPTTFLLLPQYISLAWITLAILAALLALFVSRKKKWIAPTLIILALLLGVTCYTNEVDTSSPTHLLRFLSEGWGEKRVIEGEIYREPVVKYETKITEGKELMVEKNVELIIKPHRIQSEPPEGPFTRVSGGYIQVIVYPKAGRIFNELKKGQAYGYKVRLNVPLLDFGSASNPGGLDWKKRQNSLGYYAQTRIMYSWGEPPPIQIIDRKGGLFIYKWSLAIKDKLLLGMKMTMPYPESAFLGGVTLGLRYGMNKLHLPGSPVTIGKEFRWAGTAHVLAVSGLHVTILTGLLVGIFLLFKLPLKQSAPVIILLLLMFVLITGARPATVRAWLMNSLFLISFAYLKTNFSSAALMGISLSALFILLVNPLLIPDPAFLLSFSAVLSLALLTQPIMKFMELYCYGPRFFIPIAFILALPIISFFNKEIFSTLPNFMAYVGAGIFLTWGVKYIRPLGDPVKSIGFYSLKRTRPLLRFFLLFFYAQYAIQIGMMFPLAIYYFGHIPYSGMYVNYLAIPLIGLIIPLGIVAALLTLIPVIGVHLGLVINACNYIICKAFLWICHWATSVFSWPFTPRFTIYQLLIYFPVVLFLAWLILPLPLSQTSVSLLARLRTERRLRKKLTIFLPLLLLIAISLHIFQSRQESLLEVTFLSVGYGNSILIETPGGKNILIDGGYGGYTYEYEDTASVKYKEKWEMEYGAGVQTLAPVLTKKRIQRLDTVVSTNPNLENIGGLITTLNEFNIGRVIDSLDPQKTSPQMSYGEFLNLVNERYFIENRNEELAKNIYNTYLDYLKVIERRKIPHKKAAYGTLIVRELYKGKKLEAYILNPMEPRIAHAYSNLGANSVVIRLVYGKTTFLFTSDLSPEGEARLVASGNVLKSDILQIPAHGSVHSSTPAFLKAVNPRAVVLCYGSAKYSGRDKKEAKRLKGEMQQTLIRYQGEVERVYSNDRYEDMAVIITSDGESYKIETMRERAKRKEVFFPEDEIPTRDDIL